MIMAQLKQLSAGSSQIIMMMFRDKNNAPIKADSVHVKGSIFTGSGKPFEFEVNKGVCTNRKIQNDMLLFNIVPLLGLGQMQVYTQTFLGDAKAITGSLPQRWRHWAGQAKTFQMLMQKTLRKKQRTVILLRMI